MSFCEQGRAAGSVRKTVKHASTANLCSSSHASLLLLLLLNSPLHLRLLVESLNVCKTCILSFGQ